MHFTFLIIVYALYILIKSKKTMQFLQQNRYNRGHKFFKYIKSHLKQIYLNGELLFIPLILLMKILKYKYIYLFVILYFVLILFKLAQYKAEQKKLPLVYTKRILRLYLTYICFYTLVFYLDYLFLYENYEIFFYVVLFIIIYLDQLVLILINYINAPIEKLIGLYYKYKASNKLKSMTNTKVIGITGSYGKTSSKNILSDILNIKYTAMPTPKNFNTPFGLTMTINNDLDKFNDFFIAEMGACKKGEIKELCDLVHPTYGILTKIGVAHLETFKTEENIRKTKFELIESLPEDGVGVLNKDDEKQRTYNGDFKCKILWIGIDNKDVDVYAHDIKLTNKGTTFKVKFAGDKKDYTFETKLLGKANIYNILAGLALGNYLNIPKEMLINAVKQVKPVEHRLELKKYYDMYMIDDAYNANPDGCNMALDVLKLMPGKKIVISSGMIELGSLEEKLHKELGSYMAKTVDEVILIGKDQTKNIYKGLVESKFKEENIHVLNNIMDAFKLVHKLKNGETYILLQSDLPDIFNEK